MDRRALYNQFLQMFPIDKLGNMTIEEYTNLDKKDSFCYWLESKTYELGSIWGGSAYKFGIFKFDKTPDKDNSKYAHDDKYSWSSRLGSTSEEAFKNVRNAIVKIAYHARNAEWDEIEKSTELWPVTTWKIAFLYSNEQLLPIYDKEDFLAPIATFLGLSNANKCSRAKLYRFLLEKKGDKDLYEFYDELLAINRKVWLFDAKYEPFKSNEIVMGDSVQMSDFSQFKSKEALRKAYQEKKGNTDVSIPNAYWQFIKEVNVGDIIVVYDGVKKDKSAYHKLCGWGIFTSDIIYENGVNTLIKRNVSWKKNISDAPIICRETKNQLFFHKANSKQAQSIIKLLEIPEETTSVKQSKEDIEMEYRDLINLLRYKKNIIIQGAPGVGKTYDLYKIIPYLCFPDLKDSSEENLRYLFNKLKEEKRIQYVTFHQSMDYEEFIEGIRPKIDGDDDDVTYEIKSGIFKDICTEARKLIVKESKLPLLNNNATIWKVSLARTGDNEVRKECMDNNHIRIGWDDYGSDLSQELEKGKDGRVVLKSFYDTMKIGDIVFSCYSSRIIDAIGIISGEVEWHDEYSEYKRVRKVEWLVKNIREDIYEINNQTNMTLATVYKLNSISLDNVFAILNKHGYKTTASTQKNSNPYILVIDEINRGNISKIFGELISLIEADKREGKEAEIKLNLPYSKELFSVPDNLYIIGTMNTADRSLDTLDYAMRRRFSFVKFYPKKLVTNGFNEELFRNVSRLFIKNFDEFMSNPNTSILRSEYVNDEILPEDVWIGHSYFLMNDEQGNDITSLRIQYEIIPILEEYLKDGILKDDSEVNTIIEGLKNYKC